jgi:hypothetical protein
MISKHLFIYVALVGLLMTSCYGDLDPKSLGPRVDDASTIYKTVADYKNGLAKVYGSLAMSGQTGPAGDGDISGIDEGFGNYSRGLWNLQELSTDEAVIGWNDQTIKNMHAHTWTATDVFITAMYYRIVYSVSVANEFIRAAQSHSDAAVKQYVAEARFIRALAYYHGIDMFGNVPFITEADAPGKFLPKQGSREELFNFVESELKQIVDELGAPRFEYARADKATAHMLLAKLYLNAEVYIGQPKYTEAITSLKEVFNSSYELAPEYAHNFLADNHTSPEIIFPIAFDGTHTQNYGGTTYIINAAIGGSMVREDFGSKSGWAGIRTTSALVNKFSDVSGDTDSRAMFHTDGQELEIADIGLFSDGYAITKFKNITKTGALAPNVAYSPNGDTFMDTDFPLFRLADAYLMFAEAVLRGGAGATRAEALDYVNALRERAYGDASGNIQDAALTLDFILDERARELYWEGHRRTDLIRFGRFVGGVYLWPWKGDVKDGVATDAHRVLFPIPNSDLAANPTLKQNPGYN